MTQGGVWDAVACGKAYPHPRDELACHSSRIEQMNVEFCKGARQSGFVSCGNILWWASGGNVALLQSCSADMVFILGTGYLYLRVLRLRMGDVCCKRTRHEFPLITICLLNGHLSLVWIGLQPSENVTSE